MDKITAIKAVARNLRDLILDATPSTATPSYMGFPALVHPVTNQLQGRNAYIYSGAGAGQERTITSFTPGSNSIVFSEFLTSAPSVNSTTLIFQHFQKNEYDNAIDRMIGLSELKYLEDKVATMELVGTQYEYSVPSGFQFISSLRIVPSGGSDYETDDEANRWWELPPRFWHIEANPLGSYIIAIDSRKISMDTLNEQMVRVMGQAPASAIGTDNAAIPEKLEEYLIQGASMILSSQRINENREWQAKFYMFRDMTRDLEEYIFSHRRGKKVG